MEKNIIQIMPATGWVAIFSDDATHTVSDIIPLVGWALVEYSADGSRWRGVEGLVSMDDGVTLCNDIKGFFRCKFREA